MSRRRSRLVPPWFLPAVLLALAPAVVRAADASRMIPADDLVAYVEYDGLSAHAEAWKATAAYAAFQRTPAGAMTLEIARQVLDRVLAAVPAESRPSAGDLLELQAEVLRHGVAAGLYGMSDGAPSAVIVFNGFGRKDLRASFERVVDRAGRGENGIHRQPFRGRTIIAVKRGDEDDPRDRSTVPLSLAWWFEGDDLVVVAGPTKPPALDTLPAGVPSRAFVVLDVIAGKLKSAATHLGRAAARDEKNPIAGFERIGVFFVEPGSISAAVSQAFVQPYVGLELPQGKYMHDDVQYFAPGPAFPESNAQAVAQRARMQALGTAVDPNADSPHVELADPKSKPSSVPHAPAPPKAPQGTRSVDPATVKAGMIPKQEPAGIKTARSRKIDPASFGGVSRVVGRWGFQEKALLTDLRFDMATPRRGLGRVLDQPRFRKDHLPPVPPGTRSFAIGSVKAGRTYGAIVDLGVDAMEFTLGSDIPDVGTTMLRAGIRAQAEEFVSALIGVSLRDDILDLLGTTWACYRVTAKHEVKQEEFAAPALVVAIDDAPRFAETLDRLASHVNAMLRSASGDPKAEGREKANANAKAEGAVVALESLPAPDRGYRVRLSERWTKRLDGWLEPTIMISDSYVALSPAAPHARRALEFASRPAQPWTPDGELARALDCLPAELTSLSVGDPADSHWPTLMAHLPKVVESAAALLNGPQLGEFSTFLGLARPGEFRLHIDADQVPTAKALQEHLFPSVVATTVDERGFRLIAREAIPLACAGPEVEYTDNAKKGEWLSLHLHPFLMPYLKFTVEHKLHSDVGSFSFRIKAASAPAALKED